MTMTNHRRAPVAVALLCACPFVLASCAEQRASTSGTSQPRNTGEVKRAAGGAGRASLSGETHSNDNSAAAIEHAPVPAAPTEAATGNAQPPPDPAAERARLTDAVLASRAALDAIP